MGQKAEGKEATSLAVQWLGCHTFTAGVKVESRSSTKIPAAFEPRAMERKELRMEDEVRKCVQFGSAFCPLCPKLVRFRAESRVEISFCASYHLLPENDAVLFAGFAESRWTLLHAHVTLPS